MLRILHVRGRMSALGDTSAMTAVFDGSGRMPLFTPFQGEFELRLEDAQGAAFYQARFDAVAHVSIVEPGTPPPVVTELPLSATRPFAGWDYEYDPDSDDRGQERSRRLAFDRERRRADRERGPRIQSLECGALFTLDGTGSSIPTATPFVTAGKATT